jgi:hypothetical protein
MPFAPAPLRPSPARTGRIVLVGALAAVVLAAVSVGGYVVARHRSTQTAPQAPTAVTTSGTVNSPPPTDEVTTPPTTEEPTTVPPTAGPSAVGIVTVASTVADSRAVDVATMFDTYFSGINNKQYDAVGSVLDPAGSIDPGNANQMAGLAKGTRSTQDSQIVLEDITESGSGALLAEVTFQSNQSPGDGPKGRTQETCTVWDVTYTVSMISGYRILRSRGPSRPC